jgi:hypothetical protein
MISGAVVRGTTVLSKMLREQPQPGPQHQPVGVVAPARAQGLGLGRDAVEIARYFVGAGDLDGGIAAERRVEVERAILAHRVDADFEQLAEPFGGLQTSQQQCIFSERSRQNSEAFFLTGGGSHA